MYILRCLVVTLEEVQIDNPQHCRLHCKLFFKNIDNIPPKCTEDEMQFKSMGIEMKGLEPIIYFG